jgi:hypothetical protein
MQQDHGQEALIQKTHKKWYQKRGTLLTSFLMLAIILSGAISLSGVLAHHTVTKAASPIQDEVTFLQQQAKKSLHVTSPATNINPAVRHSMAKSLATNAIATPAFNNTATSAITNNKVSAANFDGANYSYSYDALIQADIEPNLPFISHGLLFAWPNVNPTTSNGQPDNWQANGQVLPLSQSNGASQIGFIGSASNGSASGTAVVTYSDGSTQNVTLGLSDWTLGGSTQTPIANNTIISAESYRDNASGKQSIKTYLFYTAISLTANKTAVSVTLPKLSGKPQLHIFAYSNIVNTTASSYNNTGLSNDAYTTPGNLDGSGNSYSSADVAWGTGYDIYYNASPTVANSYNMTFAWPDVLPGSPDNYQADGQTIPVTFVAGETKIGFIGASTGGPSVGTAYLNYADGTRQAFQLGFSDWTLDGHIQGPSFNNNYLYGMTYRNTRSGQQNLASYLYYAETGIQSGETVTSVTLPSQVNQGQIHVYSVAAGVAGFYDNVGVSSDPGPLFGNFDGANHSYSGQALQSAGIKFSTEAAPQPVTINGAQFTLTFGNGLNEDNWIANGQAISVSTVNSATSLAFLGSAANGNSTGTGTINYTDGTSQQFSLGFSDWSATAPLYGNSIVASMTYRNSSSGTQNIKNNLYYAETGIDPTKTVADVVLPVTTGGAMHIFSVAERAGQYNNTGISNDSTPKQGNFDGSGNTYSQQAMATSKLVSGTNITSNGITFTWPTLTTAQPDNYAAEGQLVNEAAQPHASKLGFLISAINGGATGTATITYTDGTQQNVIIKSSDWCNSATAASNGISIAATMSYRNTSGGKQSITNYIYEQTFSLDATKTVQSITLPNANTLHIFSIGLK